MSTLSDSISNLSPDSDGGDFPRKSGPSPRKQQILAVAAKLFSTHGYAGTSIRQIGEEAGVLGGSLYHHIKSKEALYVEAHNMAVDTLAADIARHIRQVSDPWTRLEVACAVFLRNQLGSGRPRIPWLQAIRHVPEDVIRQLIAKRDEMDRLFDEIIAELPLPPPIHQYVYRNFLLTLLSNTVAWYKPGKLDADQIAHQIVLMLGSRAE